MYGYTNPSKCLHQQKKCRHKLCKLKIRIPIAILQKNALRVVFVVKHHSLPLPKISASFFYNTANKHTSTRRSTQKALQIPAHYKPRFLPMLRYALFQAGGWQKYFVLFEARFSRTVKIKSPRVMQGLFRKYLFTYLLTFF